jgi:hypothetical protein
MMLGGVGFQYGLDESRRKQLAAQRQAASAGPDVVEQLQGLQALRDDGHLTPEEFQRAKRLVLER